MLCHLTPFDWKFLQIGILRAKDLRKNLSILQQGGLTPVPTTQLVIRVVLLLWSYGVSNPLIPQLYILLNMRNLIQNICTLNVVYKYNNFHFLEEPVSHFQGMTNGHFLTKPISFTGKKKLLIYQSTYSNLSELLYPRDYQFDIQLTVQKYCKKEAGNRKFYHFTSQK